MDAVDLVGQLGDQPELRGLCAALAAAGLVRREPRLVRASIRMLAAHEAATALKKLIKGRVDRKRPRNARTVEQSRPRPGGRTDSAHSSFPSGHSAGAMAVAQAFAREFPEYRLAARSGAAAIAAAQVPRCAHYPTDVGAGILMGLFAEAGTALLWRLATSKAGFRPARPLPPPPPV